MKYRTLCMTFLVMMAFCLVIPAKVGILISKSSAMMNAPVKGIKSVFSSDVLELNMKGSAATGQAHCAQFKSEGCTVVSAESAQPI